MQLSEKQLSFAVDFIQQWCTNKAQSVIDGKTKTDKTFTADKEEKVRQGYVPAVWLDTVATQAKNVYLDLTHVPKLTHSSTKTRGLQDVVQVHTHLLTTHNAKSDFSDLGYNSGSLYPVAEFLSTALPSLNTSLGVILRDNPRLFKELGVHLPTDNKFSGYEEMSAAVAMAYTAKDTTFHTLSKQVFIPLGVSQNDGYVICSPTISSVLAHRLYTKIWESRSTEEGTPRDAYFKQVYHEDRLQIFNNVGRIKVTNSNHTNVSYLNNKRQGRLFLWQATPKTPKINALPKTNGQDAPFVLVDVLKDIIKPFKFTETKQCRDMLRMLDMRSEDETDLLNGLNLRCIYFGGTWYSLIENLLQETMLHTLDNVTNLVRNTNQRPLLRALQKGQEEEFATLLWQLFLGELGGRHLKETTLIYLADHFYPLVERLTNNFFQIIHAEPTE